MNPTPGTSSSGCGINLEEHIRNITRSDHDSIARCSTVDECDTVKLIEDLDDQPLRLCHIGITTLNLIIVILVLIYVCILTALFVMPSEKPKPNIETDKILTEPFIKPYDREGRMKLLGVNYSFAQEEKIQMKNKIIFVTPDSLLFDCISNELMSTPYCEGSDFRNSLLKNAVYDNYKDMIYNFIIGANGKIYEGRPYDFPIGRKHELSDINENSTLVFGIGWCFTNTPLSDEKTRNELRATAKLTRYLLTNSYLNSAKFYIELPLDCKNSLMDKLIRDNLTLFNGITIEGDTKSNVEIIPNYYTSKRITDWNNYGNYSLVSVSTTKENYTELYSKYPDYFPEPGYIYQAEWKTNHSKSCETTPSNKVPEIKIIGFQYRLNNEPICCKNKNCYINALKNLQLYHLSKNYCDINFHYVIFRSGYIAEGRPTNYASEDGDEIIIGLDYPITKQSSDCYFDNTTVVRTYRTISKILNGIPRYRSIRMCGNTEDYDLLKLNLLLNLTYSVHFGYGNSVKDTCKEWNSISIHDNSHNSPYAA